MLSSGKLARRGLATAPFKVDAPLPTNPAAAFDGLDAELYNSVGLQGQRPFFMKHFFYVCPSTRLFVNIYFLPTGWAIISFSFCIEKRNIAMPQLFHMSMLVLHPSAKKFSDGLKLKSCLNLTWTSPKPQQVGHIS